MNAPPSPLELTARNADLESLLSRLEFQQAHKLDVVASASSLRAEDGHLVVSGAPSLLSENGVTDPNGAYRPTAACDQDIAAKLKIALPYLRKCRAEALDLWDVNVNGWLRRGAADHKYLIRCFTTPSAGPGIARAMLSDAYKRIDHLDVLTAAMRGIHRSDVPVTVQSCDLTERHMYVKIFSPAIAVNAPELLRGYRSPFNGRVGADNPVVWGGFVITNSETGGGAAKITPRLVFQVCDNGYAITADTHKAVHLGGRVDEGLVTWSDETQIKTLELITSKTIDAVRQFLNPAYVQRVVRTMEAKASIPISQPEDTIQAVAQNLKFSDEERKLVLRHFLMSGDLTAGGVMHALTSAAREVNDADLAHEMESRALHALHLAATL